MILAVCKGRATVRPLPTPPLRRREVAMRLRWCGFTLLTLGLRLPALAQEQRAAIEGVARDTQGGVTPGVVVQVRGAGGLAVEGVTDGTGTYRFASLPPGRYD